MFKVSSTQLIRAVKAIDRAEVAINNLERLANNQMIYPELKKELQDISKDLKSRYGLTGFEEWKENKKIEKLKE